MSEEVFFRETMPNIIKMEFSGLVSEEEIKGAVHKAMTLIQEEFSEKLCIIILVDDQARFVMNANVISEFQGMMDMLPIEKGGLFLVSTNPIIGYLGQHLKGLVRRFNSFDEAQQFTSTLVRTRLSR